MAKLNRKYETNRTRRFHAGETKLAEASTIANIEKFGLSVWHIKDKGQDRAYFSYTEGLFDTCGKPELIVVGLREDTAHFLLNEAARRLREGIDLSQGRHAELISGVDCEFRPVDEKWVKHLMYATTRYYEGTDFPVLQAIYPDQLNRFPSEEGFNEYFAQPLLQPDAPETVREQDFWASNDPKSSLFDWKFPDEPHTAVIVTNAVNDGIEEINYVSHDLEDGNWQFLGDTMSDSGGVVVCLHHPIDKDPSLKELADLPLGWFAEREKPGEPWVRRQQEPEDSSDDENEEESG